MQVLLQPSKDLLTQRVQQRAAEGTHFMPASLLESQLALMEVDSSAYRYGETHSKHLCLHHARLAFVYIYPAAWLHVTDGARKRMLQSLDRVTV